LLRIRSLAGSIIDTLCIIVIVMIVIGVSAKKSWFWGLFSSAERANYRFFFFAKITFQLSL
jgi:hypothetical protein